MPTQVMIEPPTGSDVAPLPHLTAKLAKPTLFRPVTDLLIVLFIVYARYRADVAWNSAGVSPTPILIVMKVAGILAGGFIMYRCIIGFKRWFDYRKASTAEEKR